MRQVARLIGWMTTVTIILASGAWIFADRGWRIDLVANLTAQICVVSLILMLCWTALRWWRMLVVLMIAALLQVLALAPNRADHASTGDSAVVRVLTFNTYSRDHTGTGAVQILEESNADVFAIIEPTPEVIRLLRESEAFRKRYPYTWPARPYRIKSTIVSRWPIEGLNLRHGPTVKGQPDPGMAPTGAIIQRPEGAFVLIATHPPSPRNPTAWENGNESIRRLASMVLDLAELHDLPIVVGGDFNSTPTGWRSRYLCKQTGLRRGKPWLRSTGTWPAGLVWPARLAIDDVFVSGGVRIASWTTLPAPSDRAHSPVQIELLLPTIN